jgi:hypothetical protein
LAPPLFVGALSFGCASASVWSFYFYFYNVLDVQKLVLGDFFIEIL